ncbi:DNA-packaging protein [Rhizobium sp. BK251]|uniref:DNA-packaging protein n=1 Tax=Rhizobium sp. BK251 TaxID=2512125 RepID=UPI001050C516|nr:DNA-packaging protein [Rhizobium sp. BK251]TCL70637.1 DNA-packaging protein gp3 [Rhizobium sp. BK251]
MAPPKGNQFWKVRSSHGRKPIFATPDDLWNACVEYFEWVEKNPLYESQAFAYQGSVKVQQLPKMRAMTLAGLCIFLDINRSTWDEYRTKDDFSEVSTRVDEIIRAQKFEGAAAGLLNHSIIARDLGLADKNELTGKGGDPVQIIVTSQDAKLL